MKTIVRTLLCLVLASIVTGCKPSRDPNLPEGALYHFVSQDNPGKSLTLYEDALETTGLGLMGEDVTIPLEDIIKVRKIGGRVSIYLKKGGEVQMDLLGLMSVKEAGRFRDDLERLVKEAKESAEEEPREDNSAASEEVETEEEEPADE